MKQKSSAEKYFRRYLRIGPLALAIWRSVEARHLAEIPLQSPVLDVGCGFGEFGKVFFDKPVEVGLDNCEADLREARKVEKYAKLVLADARKMPFPKESFSTVISISTFEHIPQPEKVISEAYRVLKPGGKLVVTLETDEVDINTFYRPTFRKLGLGFFSDFCTKLYNKVYHRHSLYSKKKWKKIVEDNGFVLEGAKDIISVKVTKIFDIFLLTAWPAQIPKLLWGRRMVFRPKFAENILTSIFLPILDAEETIGTNLLLVARKPK